MMNRILPKPALITACAIACGIYRSVKVLPKTTAVLMTRKSIAVMMVVSFKIRQISLLFSLWQAMIKS